MSASPNTRATSTSISPTPLGGRPNRLRRLAGRDGAARALPQASWHAAAPDAAAGGSLEQLTSLLNLPDRGYLVLVTTWLLATLRHGGPYPLLVIAGEQGYPRRCFLRCCEHWSIPNAPVRTLPREERDLFIAANNGHVLAFDNLSAAAVAFRHALPAGERRQLRRPHRQLYSPTPRSSRTPSCPSSAPRHDQPPACIACRWLCPAAARAPSADRQGPGRAAAGESSTKRIEIHKCKQQVTTGSRNALWGLL